ncbi:uncharacterized protein DS421_12g382880 [Arachis hypogaea]|nr:uncharacterized protein DS421_12g382880 [Arachis hypogaea]
MMMMMMITMMIMWWWWVLVVVVVLFWWFRCCSSSDDDDDDDHDDNVVVVVGSGGGGRRKHSAAETGGRGEKEKREGGVVSGRGERGKGEGRRRRSTPLLLLCLRFCFCFWLRKKRGGRPHETLVRHLQKSTYPGSVLMIPSRESSSSSNHRGGRHGGPNGTGLIHGDVCRLRNVEITKGQHPKCLCGLYAIISISRTRENLSSFNDGVAEVMSGAKLVDNMPPVCEIEDDGLGQKLIELQSRIDILEVHQNVAPKIDSKRRGFNLVPVFMVLALLVWPWQW